MRPDTARPPKPFTIYQNPLAPKTLIDEAELLRIRDPERHAHVYLGSLESYSEARIFSQWIVQELDIDEVIRQRKEAIV